MSFATAPYNEESFACDKLSYTIKNAVPAKDSIPE